jgi:foldase protein PrsA
VDPATLDEQTQNQFSSQVIETLVTQVLLKQEAEKSDIVVSEESIDLQVESAKGQFESDEAFQQALSTENLTEESLRNQIWESIIINSYLQQELNLSTVTATESEIAQVYEQAIASSEAEAEAEVEVAAPLSDVYAQLEAMVIQQKQQELISQFTENLRVDAEIEIFI